MIRIIFVCSCFQSKMVLKLTIITGIWDFITIREQPVVTGKKTNSEHTEN